MINEQELIDRAMKASAWVPVSESDKKHGKPGGILQAVLVGLIVNLLAKFILENCIKTKRLKHEDVLHLPFFRRLRLSKIIRKLCEDGTIRKAWEDESKTRPITFIGNLRVKTEFNPEIVYAWCCKDVLWIAQEVGAGMTKEDFE